MSGIAKPLTIGKLARDARVGVETVRFYERKGLIPRPRRPQRGFRAYPPEAAERIRFIRKAQELGFTLREIKDLLSLRADPAADCSIVRRKAQAKLQDVIAKARHLDDIRGALETLIAACPGKGAVRACSILDTLTESANGKATPPTPDANASHKRLRRKSAMKTLVMIIEGMHCEGCSETIKALLNMEMGVQAATVSFKDGTARILFDPASVREERLIASVERAGYKAVRQDL